MYKIKDLQFINTDYEEVRLERKGMIKIFSIEKRYSLDEKKKFIDELENGIASYMLELIEKWKNDRDTLPQTMYKKVRVTSLKAWLKRNDKKKCITNDEDGCYTLFGSIYNLDDYDICPLYKYEINYPYTGENIVHQWFHDLINKLYYKEVDYLRSIDPFEIKLQKVIDYAEQYNIYFENRTLEDIVWNRYRDISEKTLDTFLAAYEQLGDAVNEITVNLNEKIKNS